MLFLTTDPFTLPPGTRVRYFSRDDQQWFINSAGEGCQVVEVDEDSVDCQELIDSGVVELCTPEHLTRLFPDNNQLAAMADCPEQFFEIPDPAVKDAQVQAEISGILERAYGADSPQAVAAKESVSTAISAGRIAPIGRVDRVN